MHYHLGQVEVVMMGMMVINYIVESVSTMQNEAHRSYLFIQWLRKRYSHLLGPDYSETEVCTRQTLK